MIEFNYMSGEPLQEETTISNWISSIIQSEGYEPGDIVYVFCSDDYLLGINREFLNHDTLTDIISFDYKMGNTIHGEIYISRERVEENSIEFGTTFEQELKRVIIHGILHFCGYKDGSSQQKTLMRQKEDDCLKLIDY